MGDIYHRAERVVMWLGPATYETNVLMDSMKLLEEERINHSRNISEQARREIWLNIQPMLRSMHSDLEFRQRTGLESLFGRSWFRRVWIVQEVANARAAIVVCGAKSVSASTFALIPSLMGIKPDLHCQSILDIMPGRSREESWWSQKRDLQTLLVKFGKSDASDPRDNIYALLGLSSDACDSDLLRAEYSKPVQVVIMDAALFLLQLPKAQTSFLSRLSYWTMPQFLKSVRLLGNEALGWAQDTTDRPIIKLLLACDNIDVNLEDEYGSTPLQIAEGKKDMGIVRLLLARPDISVKSKDSNGRTLLQRATINKDTETVRLLLARPDIDVNSKDNNGQTLLQIAGINEDMEIVRLLLARVDTDVSWRGNDGVTLTQTAVWKTIAYARRQRHKLEEYNWHKWWNAVTFSSGAKGRRYDGGSKAIACT